MAPCTGKVSWVRESADIAFSIDCMKRRVVVRSSMTAVLAVLPHVLAKTALLNELRRESAPRHRCRSSSLVQKQKQKTVCCIRIVPESLMAAPPVRSCISLVAATRLGHLLHTGKLAQKRERRKAAPLLCNRQRHRLPAQPGRLKQAPPTTAWHACLLPCRPPFGPPAPPVSGACVQLSSAHSPPEWHTATLYSCMEWQQKVINPPRGHSAVTGRRLQARQHRASKKHLLCVPMHMPAAAHANVALGKPALLAA